MPRKPDANEIRAAFTELEDAIGCTFRSLDPEISKKLQQLCRSKMFYEVRRARKSRTAEDQARADNISPYPELY